MRLRFLTDYRSRAWCRRFQAGEVVTLDNPDLVRACLEAGVAEVIAEDVSAEPHRIDETERAVEPETETAEPRRGTRRAR